MPHVLRSNATFVVNTRCCRRRRHRRGQRHETLMRTPPPQLGKNVGKKMFSPLRLSKISWLRRSCEPARIIILLFHSLGSSEKNLRPLSLSPSKEKMSCQQNQQGANFCNEVSVSPDYYRRSWSLFLPFSDPISASCVWEKRGRTQQA